MATITIGAVEYFSYQTVEEVDAYANGAISAAASAWRAMADQDTKARAAVSATRLIDRQVWAGSKTDPDQDGEFPRTGLTYPDGSPVDPDTVPDRVLSAHSELSMILVSDDTILANPAQVGGTKRLKAGSAEIEYFAPLLAAGRFPTTIQELIGLWFGGAGSDEGSEATGTCKESAFDSAFDVRRGF
jgi:hypothetical protein